MHNLNYLQGSGRPVTALSNCQEMNSSIRDAKNLSDGKGLCVNCKATSARFCHFYVLLSGLQQRMY